jgi:Domain of unknown function (DUF4349)
MRSPELAIELHAARPVAPPELRERVRAVTGRELPRRRTVSLPLRRSALVAASAALAAAVGIALVHGITSSGREQPLTSASRGMPAKAGHANPNVLEPATGNIPRALERGPTAVQDRLQQYGAMLRVQVQNREQLSSATRRAMRVARLLGGYVASVQYSAPRNGRGAAALIVRVPVDRVQDAVEEYSALGTILAQKVRITDVTRAVAEEAKEIARLRTDIARLEAGGVTPAERPRLAAEQARLDYLTKRRAGTVRRAELARIALHLTTKPKPAAAAPSRFHRTMSDAGGVLVREGEILLYALIVGGPLLLLGMAAIGAARLAQRRRDAQLLEKT